MSQSWGFVPSFAAEFPCDNPALHLGVSWVCLNVSGPARPVLRAKSLGRSAFPEAVSAPRAASSVREAPLAVEELAAAATPPPSPEPSAPVGAGSESSSPGHEAGDAGEQMTERLPESVLGVLLQTLDLDPTPEGPPAEAANETRESEAVDAAPAVASDAGGAPEFAFDTEEGPIDGSVEGVAAAVPAPAAEPAAPDAYAAFVDALVGVALDASATRAAAILPGLLAGSADLTSLGDDTRRALSAAGITTPDGAPGSSFVSTAVAWRKVLRGESSDFSDCGTSTLDVWGTDLLKALGVGAAAGTDVRRELRRRGVAAFGMLLAA